MRITYDEAKRQSNIAEHGLDFAALSFEFFESCYMACKAGPLSDGWQAR